MATTERKKSAPKHIMLLCGKLRSFYGIGFLTLASILTTTFDCSVFAEGHSGNSSSKETPKVTIERTFNQDVDFLKQHVDTIILRSHASGARAAIVPAYQGRVMTTTASGPSGNSFGWINYAHIESGQTVPQINVYGGEERFWLGPEGGQYSIFFKPDTKFEFSEWATPSIIDTEPFDVVEASDLKVSFRKESTIRNSSRTEFKLRIDRLIELLSASEAQQSLGVDLGSLAFVGYRSSNRITNIGDSGWSKETGLLSIWLLGMYKPGPQTTVVIPYQTGATAKLGRVVNDAYFGKVPEDRLKDKEGVLFFSGDGTYRSKIGVSPQRSRGICGSYDAASSVLTVVKYSQPESDVTEYVNSMWEFQKEPYKGDAINAYNDGPPEPGAKPLGPFYELETSSPALELGAGESGVHQQDTYHIEGEHEQLNQLALKLFGVGLDQIQSALE